METKKNNEKPNQPKRETIEKAVDALLKWVKSQPKYQKPQLLDHSELLYMVITLKEIPSNGRINPYKVPIPNPLFPLDGSQEICLIINDKENGLSSKVAKAKVKEEGLPVSKVLTYSKLRTDYKPFEAKRKLCGSFDMFMADRSVIPLLPKFLGKTFFKKKKHPIPVDLSHKRWRGQFEFACRSAFVYISGGTCCVVKVGRVSQDRHEIVENVVAMVDGLAEVIPKKWKNIRSLHLKSLESVALPLYQAIPERPFRIQGVSSGRELLVLGKKGEEKELRDRHSEKEVGTKGFKKGRIHDVRYMDHMLEDLDDGLVVDEDHNDGLLGDDNQNADQNELDFPITREVQSGDNESDGELLKSGKKNRCEKEVTFSKRRKNLSLKDNISSVNGGKVNDAALCDVSTPASGHKKKSMLLASEDGAVASDVKATTKKGKTKQVEDEAGAGIVKLMRASEIQSGVDEPDARLLKSGKKGRSGKKLAGAISGKDLSLEGDGCALSGGNADDSVQCDYSTPDSAHRKRRKLIDYKDGAVANSARASAKKEKTKHAEDGAVADSGKASAKTGKAKHIEDGTVANSVKTSAKKGKKKL